MRGRWIDEIVADDAVKQAQAEARASKEKAARLTVESNAPAFMVELRAALEADVESLSELGIRGAVCANRSKFENHYHVDVALIGIIPTQTYTDIRQTTGEPSIRCCTRENKAFRLHLAVSPDGKGICAYAEKAQLEPMNPVETAEFILRPMVEWVRDHGAV